MGQNYQGKEVHNPVFPYDYDSGTNPLYWPYVEISGGVESWSDITKYQTQKQKEYMLSEHLWRNDTEYDFTAPMIGLNKTRVENVATWQTNGVIEVRKKDANGVYWSATFYIKPMAADASLIANLNVDQGLSYHFSENGEDLLISVSYGANVENLSGYAEVDDIKQLRTELWVEGVSRDCTTVSKQTEVISTYLLTIPKSDLGSASQKQISIKCMAMLETCFQGDLPMYDEKECFITIYSGEMLPEEEVIEEKDRNVFVKDVNRQNEKGVMPQIVSIDVHRVSTHANGIEKLTNLLVAKKTSIPFVMAGQVIEVEVDAKYAERVMLEVAGEKSILTFDTLTKQFEWDEPKQRGQKTRFASLQEFEASYRMPKKMKVKSEGEEHAYYTLRYLIPYQTKQTLHSWNSLRQRDKNAFEIPENELFTRIRKPYEIVIKASSEVGTVTQRVEIDVFEAWNTIYNRDLSQYIK